MMKGAVTLCLAVLVYSVVTMLTRAPDRTPLDRVHNFAVLNLGRGKQALPSTPYFEFHGVQETVRYDVCIRVRVASGRDPRPPDLCQSWKCTRPHESAGLGEYLGRAERAQKRSPCFSGTPELFGSGGQASIAN